MYSGFLSSYTNIRESLGELEKAVETLACGSCSHSISRSPKLSLLFVWLDRNTVHVFYFLNNNNNNNNNDNNNNNNNTNNNNNNNLFECQQYLALLCYMWLETLYINT